MPSWETVLRRQEEVQGYYWMTEAEKRAWVEEPDPQQRDELEMQAWDRALADGSAEKLRLQKERKSFWWNFTMSNDPLTTCTGSLQRYVMGVPEYSFLI